MKRLLSIALLQLAACGAPEPPPAVPDPQAATGVAPAEAPAEQPDFPAIVTSKKTRLITADFQAEVKVINIHQRDRVRAGDILVKLDDTTLQSEYKQALAQEKSSRNEAGSFGAAAAQAKQQMKRDHIMIQKGIAPIAQIESSKAQYAQNGGQSAAASERAEGAHAKASELKDLITKAEVKAPIDGVITALKVKPGEVVQKGSPIVRVFDDHDLIVRFAVPKEYRSMLAFGKRVELHLPESKDPIWATIYNIADEEPPITITIVEADIDDNKLRPDEIQVASEGRVRIEEAQPAGAHQ